MGVILGAMNQSQLDTTLVILLVSSLRGLLENAIIRVHNNHTPGSDHILRYDMLHEFSCLPVSSS